MIKIGEEKQIKKDVCPSLFAHFHLIIMTKELLNLVRLRKNWTYVVLICLQK